MTQPELDTCHALFGWQRPNLAPGPLVERAEPIYMWADGKRYADLCSGEPIDHWRLNGSGGLTPSDVPDAGPGQVEPGGLLCELNNLRP